MSKPLSFLPAAAALCITIGTVETGRADDGADAQLMLDRLKQRYATIETYSDNGEFESLQQSPEWRSGDEVAPARRILVRGEFSTVFRRPDGFRFKHTSTLEDQLSDRERAASAAVWKNDGGVFKWDSESGNAVPFDGDPTGEADVYLALYMMSLEIAAVQEILRVPSLLEYAINPKWRLLELDSPKYIGEDDVDGTNCHHVIGFEKRASLISIWFGADDLLIRRLESYAGAAAIEEAGGLLGVDEDELREYLDVDDIAEFSVIERCSYQPALDPALDDSDLVFTPPDEE